MRRAQQSTASSSKSRSATNTAPPDPPLKVFGPKDLPHHGPRCQFVFPPKEDGMAVYEYPNSYFKYVGDWKNGKKTGKGVFYVGCDSYYEGDFVDGEIVGVGDRYFANGSHYHGEFSEGEFNGKGTFTDAVTGEVYTGEFKGNRRHGEGILKMPDGTTYKGLFYDNRKQGEGEYTDAEGNSYKGEWKKNKIEGNGVMRYANGDIYSGCFVDGKKHGKGTIYWASNGLSYSGVWNKDTCSYNPSALTVCDLPPFTPGTALSNIVISVVGGDGESGRKLRVNIEIGRIDPNVVPKKTIRGRKNEPVERVPRFLTINSETNENFLDLVVQEGSAVIPVIQIPQDAENNTYTLEVKDLSDVDPLPSIMTDFQFINSPTNANSDKTSAKGRISRRGANSRASNVRTMSRK